MELEPYMCAYLQDTVAFIWASVGPEDQISNYTEEKKNAFLEG